MPTEILGAAAAFADLVDLAQDRLGGEVLAVSDEWFAEAANLLRPGRGVFDPDRFTDRGKWMDGWESRRRRGPGHDWCLIRLGVPGMVRGVDVDTNHFTGNHPSMASLEGCEAAADADAAALEAATWRELLPQVPLKRGSQNLFAARDAGRVTHVRLRIYPDGGVARLRVYGEARPDRAALEAAGAVDLAAVEHGGRVMAVNDMYFGAPHNLLFPDRPPHMGDGWETRRKREATWDWAVIELGLPGEVDEVELDTTHFKGNYPDRCTLEGLDAGDHPPRLFCGEEAAWQQVLGETPLAAHDRKVLGAEALGARGPFTHLRLRIFPDGGVARLRVRGRPAWERIPG